MLSITKDNVFLGCKAENKEAVLHIIADAFVKSHSVNADCFAALQKRENSISTYINNGVAIPHLAKADRGLIVKNEIKVFQFPDGVLWDKAHVMFIAIAILSKQNDEHIEVLKALVPIIENSVATYALSSTTHKEEFIEIFSRTNLNS